MAQKKTDRDDALEQRRKAEDMIRAEGTRDLNDFSFDEVQGLVHELRVHQIELEMQNEELRRAQMEIDTARARYFDLYDLAPVGYVTLSEKGLVLEANLTWATMMGLERALLKKQPITRFIVSEDQDVFYHHRRLLFGTGAPQVCELRLVKGNGSSFWARLEATLVPDAPDGVLLCRAAISDITDRRLAHDAIRDSQMRLNLALDAANAGIWEWDLKTDGHFWSDQLWRLYGLEPNSRTPCFESWVLSIIQEDRAQVESSVKDCVEQGSELKVEWRVRAPNGETRWLMSRGNPLRDETGQVVRYLGVAIDITALKEAEKENERLQDQLHQAQKMEAVGTLAGGVAHDFNNLLQAINGYTQMLLMDKEANDPDCPSLMTILKSGERAAELIRKLLLFSRKMYTAYSPVDLNQEVAQAQRLLERTIPKMIDIEVHPARDLWKIKADPAQIEQILLNLGTNAADAMPNGGKLVIETENVTLDEDFARDQFDGVSGNFVLLTISDTGEGMSPETMSKIFEPFFTTKEVGKGTGLGLASVYGIAKSHGGNIKCYSEMGRGTTFRIYLPATEQAASGQAASSEQSLPTGGLETILLVDDESNIRELASKVLKKVGYSILTASSGEEALDIFSGKPDEIDLVIMDIGMPGMGGHQCLEGMVRLDPSAKVLIASGYSMNEQVMKTLKAGAVGYVGKPYQVVDFLEKVRNILDEGK